MSAISVANTLRVTHRFADTFTLIVPAELFPELEKISKAKLRIEWLKEQNWLLIEERSNTGRQLQDVG